jgi:hypothetical protein
MIRNRTANNATANDDDTRVGWENSHKAGDLYKQSLDKKVPDQAGTKYTKSAKIGAKPL